MKFTLAILPAFFALSAFGNPVELDARQMPMCDVANAFRRLALSLAQLLLPVQMPLAILLKFNKLKLRACNLVKLISSALSPTQSNVFPPALRPASLFRPVVMVALVPHPVAQRPVSQHPVSPVSQLE
ncbi:hypothetical protein AGABI2DRAFT_196217 [Agaricus bisporus var. bisporus H97]|uniref:hypothetical protein n=1 Tax=Agaricus bisporus var. bisporus (strain H97 / ATCC MYA-4626 / FGSC 10389) TaxID=936046 RepID=UPI00029F7382|nr:hypothetical protein AGABI2DRAFT_196217 [Agaricus bisporus var. bisporus H97]EKV41726.1 hypothetical protein AGABI2DRAFT_196217 [Agaricus bisporus var. bisporus H97]